MTGRTIGKYRVVGQIGRGGAGIVYKAVDESLNRDVAIKTLSPDLANTEVMARFHAEATILARLNHPQIATIYELLTVDGELLMVMEFVRGLSLDRIAERLGPLAPDRAACLIDLVLSGLEHAHRAGIVHRDIKPANVMVTGEGGVKIMDFGIARVLGAEHKTVDFRLMGTPAYMSPEQVMGEEVDGRSDLYSVGVLFYRLLTGALPFAADTALAMLQRQIREQPLPLHAHRQDLPDWCERIVGRALAKAAADRFQSAEEFRTELLRATGPLATAELARAFVLAAGEDVPVRVPGGAIDAPPAGDAPAYEPTVVESPAAARPAAFRWAHVAAAAVVVGAVASGAVAMGLMSLPGGDTRTPDVAVPVLTMAAPAPGVSAVPLPPADSPQASPEPEPVPPPGQPVAPPGAVAPSRPGPRARAAAVTGESPERVVASAKRLPPPPPPAGAPVPVLVPVAVPAVAAPAPMEPIRRAAVIEEPSLVFDTRAYVGTRKPREQKAQLVLADGRITLIPQDDPATPLSSFPYERVLSIEVSRHRDPLWNSPQGPAPVARAGGMLRRFGIQMVHDWVALRTRTDDQFIAMRFDEVILKRVLLALEERTGRSAEFIVVPKDDEREGS